MVVFCKEAWENATTAAQAKRRQKYREDCGYMVLRKLGLGSWK
jgi:hypothetical protein